jgi:hypothetical protein
MSRRFSTRDSGRGTYSCWVPWHAVVAILSLRSEGIPLSTLAGSWNEGAASDIHG